jgi:hypothetical protein
MDDSNSKTVTVEYGWENTPYDTQQWQYVIRRGDARARLGVVTRVIRARQSYDERVHEYQARAFTTKQTRVFDTRVEAEAWVTACERM